MAQGNSVRKFWKGDQIRKGEVALGKPMGDGLPWRKRANFSLVDTFYEIFHRNVSLV